MAGGRGPDRARRRSSSSGRRRLGVGGTDELRDRSRALSRRVGREDRGRDTRSSTRCGRIKTPRSRPSSATAASGRAPAIEATHKRMRAGMTEHDVSRILEEEFARQGVRGGGLVQFGPSSAFPARRAGRGTLAQGRRGPDRLRAARSAVTAPTSRGRPASGRRRTSSEGLRRSWTRRRWPGIEALRRPARCRRGRGPRGAQGHRGRRATASSSRTASATGSGWTGTSIRTSSAGNRSRFATGNVQTIEPGIYMPEQVRSADRGRLRACRPDGPKSLPVRPGEMMVLG